MGSTKTNLAGMWRWLRSRDALGASRTSAVGEDEARAGQAGRDDIPVVHRLAIVYLMLPLAIWLVGWFEWWFGVPAVVVLSIALWHVLSGTWRLSLQPVHVAIVLVALGWVMTTAAGGIFDLQNWDWPKHRAIFLALARGDWPVYVPTWAASVLAFVPGDAELSLPILRYYLGYYLVPGLLGKWLGVGALNWAVPLWTWGGVALLLLMFLRGFSGAKLLAASLILVFFSGMDVVTALITEGWAWLTFSVALDTPDGWPRVWLGTNPNLGATPSWDMSIIYVSNLMGLMWAPQHFLSGGLYALLIVQLRRNRRFLAVSGVLLGGCLLWSPFIALGLLPLAAVLVMENGIRPFLRWQNLLPSVPLAVFLLSYLASGTEEMRRGWLWENTALSHVVRVLPAEYLIQFLFLAILLLLLRPQLLKEPFFIAVVATLLLLPWYSYGRYNDLVMRALMPSLSLLSYFCARALLDQRQTHTTRGPLIRHAALTGLIVAVLGVGAFGGLIHLARAYNDHDFAKFRYTEFGPYFSISRVVSNEAVRQYLTDDLPGWYRRLLRDSPPGQPAVGQWELVIRSHYDLYLRADGIVSFVRATCAEEDVNAKFILHVYPLSALGEEHDTLDFGFYEEVGLRHGDTCVTARAVPDYAIGRVRAGQYNPARTGQRWLESYFSEQYRERLLSAAGAPLIRSNFDVYMLGKRLLYNKDPCTEADLDAPFKLDLWPLDLQDLAADRREKGFETLEFTFGGRGGWIGSGCFMMVDLPDFALRAIATGQYFPGGRQVWEGTATLGE